MKRERKIDFISGVVTSDLSGASLKNKEIAEKVRIKLEKDLNIFVSNKNIVEDRLKRCNDNYVDDLMIMLGYKQVI